MSNALMVLNQFPSQNTNPLAALVFIDVNGDGSLWQMSLNTNPAGTYPSNPTSITAGAGVQMSPLAGEILLSSTAAVDLNTAAPTLLYTVPAASFAEITRIVVRNASTSLTTVSFSIGFNSATFNNVLADATHTELTGNTLYTSLAPKAGATKGVAADTLKLLNNILQGGAATCTIDIFGYLTTT
jgi:hypothetical protein